MPFFSHAKISLTTSAFLLLFCTHAHVIWSLGTEESVSFSPVATCENKQFDSNYDLSKPLSLCELIDIGLNNNPTTQKIWSQANAACFYLQMSKSLLYPVIGVQDSFQYIDEDIRFKQGTPTSEENGSVFFAGSPNNGSFYENTLSFTLDYLLFDFGGRCGAIESARQALYAARWQYSQTVQDVMIEIVRTYTKYQENKATLEARLEDVKNAQVSYQAAEQQFQAGLKTRVDVLQAKSILLNAEINAVDARGDLQISMSDLAKAAGLPANTKLILNDIPKEFFDIHDIALQVDDLIATAKDSRADLAALISQIYQKEADVTVAYSDGMPTLGFSVDLERMDYINSPLQEAHQYTTSLNLNIPIFRGFFYENQEKRAKANVETAYAAWAEQEQQAILEIMTYYFTFKTSIQDVKYSEEYLHYSQAAYDVALSNYRAGVGNILDLLQTQGTLSNARARLIQAKSKWVTSLANLAYSIGRL